MKKLYLQAITLTIYGIQVDIQAAIIINSQTGIQMSFNNVYFVRLIPAHALLSSPPSFL